MSGLIMSDKNEFVKICAQRVRQWLVVVRETTYRIIVRISKWPDDVGLCLQVKVFYILL